MDLDKASKKEFNDFLRAAKVAENKNNLTDALLMYQRAQAVHISFMEHPKLKKKVKSLLKQLQTTRATEDASAMTVEDDDSARSFADIAGTKIHEERIPMSSMVKQVECESDSSGDEATSTHRVEARPPVVPQAFESLTYTVMEGDTLASLPGGFGVPMAIYNKLYSYQRDGLAWMWSLHASCPTGPSEETGRGDRACGGILADDMGLGKTIQCVAFIAGLFHSQLAETVLVIVPVSIIPVWEKEFQDWAPELRVKVFHGPGKVQEKGLASVKKRGGVIITSYGMCVSRIDQLGGSRDGKVPDESEPWDAVFVDEGHKIKNPSTQVAKAVNSIPSRYRLLLSGTPIQNDLDELWALFSFVTEAKVLGSRRTFNTRIASLIVAARDRHASVTDKARGREAADLLASLIRPYMIRREKDKILRTAAEGSTASAGAGATGTEGEYSDGVSHTEPVTAQIGHKKELVIWNRLCPTQMTLYKRFLESEEVALVLNKSRSPLAAITVLKKICCHPFLLGHALENIAGPAAGEVIALDTSSGSGEGADAHERRLSLTLAHEGGMAAHTASATELVFNSGKLQCCVRLLTDLIKNGHKSLVFSQSKVMLDILQSVLAAGLGDDSTPAAHVRIDGDVLDPADRRKMVQEFNTRDDLPVCLLTTGVGAHGLTITGADRVIIFDPTWNPAIEQQAVDRAYRVGQRKDVVTYRFITCGTVEEKMYRLQVFKGGLSTSIMAAASRTAVGGREATRVLTKTDLKDLFSLGNTDSSETEKLFRSSDMATTCPSEAITKHVAAVASGLLGEFCSGVSHHDQVLLLRGRAERKSIAPVEAAVASSTVSGVVTPGASVATSWRSEVLAQLHHDTPRAKAPRIPVSASKDSSRRHEGSQPQASQETADEYDAAAESGATSALGDQSSLATPSPRRRQYPSITSVAGEFIGSEDETQTRVPAVSALSSAYHVSEVIDCSQSPTDDGLLAPFTGLSADKQQSAHASRVSTDSFASHKHSQASAVENDSPVDNERTQTDHYVETDDASKCSATQEPAAIEDNGGEVGTPQWEQSHESSHGGTGEDYAVSNTNTTSSSPFDDTEAELGPGSPLVVRAHTLGSGIATDTVSSCQCTPNAPDNPCDENTSHLTPQGPATTDRQLEYGSPMHAAPCSAAGSAGVVCSRHLRTMQRLLAGVRASSLHNCTCSLSPGSAELVEYAVLELVERSPHADTSYGESFETRQETMDALETALDALAVCDADPQLHIGAMKLAAELGWLAHADIGIGSGR